MTTQRKIALITGGSRGIGRAIADALAAEHYKLCLVSRSKEKLEETRNELRNTYPEVQIDIFSADLSLKSDIDRLSSYTHESYPRIHVLVNNAGVFMPGLITDEDDNNLVHMMNTNLYSAYHLTRALLDQMLPFEQGHIFNMCSVASLQAYPGGSNYCISKFALLGFSKCLREELKERGIAVTAILPGATWSDSWSGSDLPPARLMQARDIAIAVSSALKMSPQSVIEEIVLRPQLGDI